MFSDLRHLRGEFLSLDESKISDFRDKIFLTINSLEGPSFIRALLGSPDFTDLDKVEILAPEVKSPNIPMLWIAMMTQNKELIRLLIDT